MNELFECKVKYNKILESGKEKLVTETYLLQAVSFTDAEKRIYEEMEKLISGEFLVIAIKRANYSEIVPDNGGDVWYKGKVNFLALDETAGREKKASEYVLVTASNVDEAYATINHAFSDMTIDFSIEGIHDSKIIDYFPFR
jgi:hypothetical protein